jgi:1-acyl-sn-glycerol-3-phosphate acyltransferase
MIDRPSWLPFEHLALPKYPLPWSLILQILGAALLLQPRSFRRDSQRFVAGLRPPLAISGVEAVDFEKALLLTINHYHRPGFRAWWLPLSVSAVVPCHVHWMMTAAWTFPGRPFSKQLTSLSRRLFRRIAAVYGFSTMPPMPPDPDEVGLRARSIRSVLTYARRTPSPVIGFAPEGRDSPDGRLMRPPPGAGRFIHHLAQLGLEIVPIGAFEANGSFQINFGSPYRLEIPNHLPVHEIDNLVSRLVMRSIANLLPPEMVNIFD